MNRRYKDLIESLVDYIEEHIEEDMTLIKLAEFCYISPFHLHRIFKGITHHNLMEYVRKRKLCRSLKQLVETDYKILDIALLYGFQHAQSYNYAFKQLFGMTPTKYRVEKLEVKITQRLDTTQIYELKNGAVGLPYFVSKGETYLVGRAHKIIHQENHNSYIANQVGLDFIHHDLDKIKRSKDKEVYIGLVNYSYFPDIYNQYVPSTEALDLLEIPEGLQGYTLPSCNYAVFTYIGFHPPHVVTIEHLVEAYIYIMDEWLPKSRFTQKYPFHFEKIKIHQERENYCEVQFYFPIQ